ncbi:MAG: outer membrane protein assembly factor BamD [Pseudomonadota bacterium]
MLTVKRYAISARNVCFAMSLALVTACGGFGEDEQPLETFTPEELFKRAELDLEQGDPAEAAALFGEVERLYPFSEFARRALVMQAFALHTDRDYEGARGAAERFLINFPGDPDAAWAQYILALTYYDQIEDVGRDQGLTFEALQNLREVIETYPNSEFANSSVLKFDLAFDHLAAKEMEVGRFYLKRGHYIAAINRFRVVVEDFETTSQTPEALHRLVEAYLSLGLDEEAQTAGAILGFNFRSTDWYEDSFNLLTERGLEPQARGNGFLASIYRQTVRGEWL